MSDAAPTGKTPKCPICGKPRVPEFRPFCSERCKLVDLNRWLSEGYRVPGGDNTARGSALGSLRSDDDAES